MNQFGQPNPTVNSNGYTWDAVLRDISYRSFPTCKGQSISDMVVRDSIERDRLGAEKYGTRLQPFNGRDSLRDAYEESLDQVVYLKNNAFETGQSYHVYIYHYALKLCVEIRRQLFLRDGK